MTAQGFRHEALMYSSRPEFLAGTVPFIRDGIAAGEPVLVVESDAKIQLLRAALGGAAAQVMFADMAKVGANPARIIPAWRDFVDLHGGGRRLRGIGEPIWSGRTATELAECQRHEGLLNVAFAGGQSWDLLCPYDTATLDLAVIAEARRSHEFVSEAGESAASPDYRGVKDSGAPFAQPLSERPPDVRKFGFDRDRLVKLRREVITFATGAGLTMIDATHLVTAVNEIASNSVIHGGGKGMLWLWRDGGALVAEVCDSGSYGHPLADRVRPGASTSDGRGLWLANQLCDLVQIRSLQDAAVVRLHMKVDRGAN